MTGTFPERPTPGSGTRSSIVVPSTWIMRFRGTIIKQTDQNCTQTRPCQAPVTNCKHCARINVKMTDIIDGGLLDGDADAASENKQDVDFLHLVA